MDSTPTDPLHLDLNFDFSSKANTHSTSSNSTLTTNINSSYHGGERNINKGTTISNSTNSGVVQGVAPQNSKKDAKQDKFIANLLV